jgi:fumarate reductase flavoprotein subunit
MADIVVIGGGGAGLVAAVVAAEKGAKVIVLEKRHNPGGNAVFAIGLFVLENPPAEGQDIKALRDDFFKKAMSYAHWKINPRLIRALLEKSGDTVRWLEEKGMQFERREFGPGGLPLPFYKGTEKTAGAGVVSTMTRKCEEMGVPIFCDTGARKLLVDKAGAVTGVLAASKDKEIKITARSVIIATGGFAGNKELMNKYVPYCHYEDMYLRGLPHQGDGTVMATAIGAASDSQAVLEIDGPYFPWSSIFFPRVSMNRHAIWLNQRGERYTDESLPNLFESTNSLFRQPGKVSYTVFDENIKQIILSFPGGPMGGDGNWAETVDSELRLHAGEGRIKIADSWDEIAGFMEVVPAVLQATIDEYNAACDKGHDDIFTKATDSLVPLRTPPYYAIRCRLGLLVTHGGIRINHRTEVVDERDNPIPGLYAAGVEVAGREAGTYNSAMPGHSFGFTVHSGRIAGENAAEFAKGK